LERDRGTLKPPVGEVIINDIVVLKPGDKVPVDGEVVDGSTSIDESMVAGSLHFRATKVGAGRLWHRSSAWSRELRTARHPRSFSPTALRALTLVAVGSGDAHIPGLAAGRPGPLLVR
jgi:hypothetical protein